MKNMMGGNEIRVWDLPDNFFQKGISLGEEQEGIGLHNCRLLIIRHKLQDIGGLAVEGQADGFEGAETDGFGLTRFEDREVGEGKADLFGEFVEGHFPFRHDDVEIYDNGHN
jgi:hypothetical protein